jgi:hypothetical protein
VFFPKTGSNYNKISFQFEKSYPLKKVLIKNTSVQTITDATAVAANPNITTTG